MTGLNNTKPHYVVAHCLGENGLRQLSPDDSLGVTVVALVALGKPSLPIQTTLRVDSAELVEWRPSNWAFRGCVTMSVAGEDLEMKCVGYLAERGTGVLWVEDGVTPLDDPTT